MHRYEEIQEKMDEIAVRDLYLMIAHLRGKITMDDVVQASRSYTESVKRHMELATEVGVMFHENEAEESRILRGAT